MKRVEVKVKSDHLQRLSKVRKPILAVAELIWNALDADATNVQVTLRYNAMTGLEEIRVTDNGHGIAHDDAIIAFESLGGSWKGKNTKSRTKKRLLHGKAGKGRFRAFSLGEIVEWRTVYRENGTLQTCTIKGNGNSLGVFEIDEPTAARGSQTGTEVSICNLDKNYGSLAKEHALPVITEYFALYLRLYADVELWYDGVKVDPRASEVDVSDYDLAELTLSDATKCTPGLTIIEWASRTDRALYLCNGDGFALEKVQPGIQAPGFTFTAYLKADFLERLDEQGALVLEEMHPDLELALAAAREKMRDHFRERRAESAKELVHEWKREQIYPYEGEPGSILETTERQVFDVVALNVNEYLRDFDTAATQQKKFAFRLLRQAIEESPAELQRIFGDVLDLPREKKEELAELLERTTLTAIINASRTVADRLNFLRGLEILVFDPQSKEQILERRQLHRIVADHTWIFGEQFNLAVNDQSLTEVLNKHLKLLERENESQEPVLTEDGKTGIVDLMMSRLVPQSSADKRHHLVVELKRPKVKIDHKAESQIFDYANAVQSDERFRDTDTEWTFWAVSNEIAEVIRKKASQADQPEGRLYKSADGKVEIWTRTWGQIIESCRARLQFFQRQLEFSADRDSALEYLRKMHGKYLPDVLVDADSRPNQSPASASPS